MTGLRKALATSIVLLLSIALVASGAPKEIRILHINDFHGWVERPGPEGSAEPIHTAVWLAAKVKELRAPRESLFLVAGDAIQGQNWANVFRGESVIKLLDLMRPDAMVLGNHEFDFGQEVLKSRIAEASFPLLGANVIGLPEIKPYIIKECGGLKVGIIGVVTEEAPVATHPKNVVGLTFLSPREAIEKYLPEVKKSADLVVVLSHCGYYEDRKLAEALPDVDVIVGGHSHTRVETPSQVGKTLVVQAWEYGKVLGVLDLTVDDRKVVRFDGHLEEIASPPPETDPRVAAVVGEYMNRLDATFNVKVAETGVDLDASQGRQKETNFGDLLADIMRETSGSDVAITNAGGIRASIPKGDVLVKHVYTALPFDNYIVAVKLTGTQVRSTLEHAVSGVERNAGGFPQVSGLTFTYCRTAPVGARVRDVSVGGRPLDPDREYSVATNDFIAAGGDGFTAFGEAVRSSKDFAVVGGAMIGEKLTYSDPGTWLRDVVMEYMKQKKVLSPAVSGRITEVPCQ